MTCHGSYTTCCSSCIVGVKSWRLRYLLAFVFLLLFILCLASLPFLFIFSHWTFLFSHWTFSVFPLDFFCFLIGLFLLSHWTFSVFSLDFFCFPIGLFLFSHWTFSVFSLDFFCFHIGHFLFSHWTFLVFSLDFFSFRSLSQQAITFDPNMTRYTLILIFLRLKKTQEVQILYKFKSDWKQVEGMKLI